MIETQFSAADYQRAFDEARAQSFPVIDEIEDRYGHYIDRDEMEDIARVLACPVKANGANWQHGRVLYAVARHYLSTHKECVLLFDCGTAKGFSALCLQWALNDSGATGSVVSVDVLDPKARVRRNTVAEVDGYKTLAETLAPWPEASAITFLKSTGIEWLSNCSQRINLAFVDGKHTGSVVKAEGMMLAARQVAGDVVVFDDVQIEGVAQSVQDLARFYEVTPIKLSDKRSYAIGVRR